MTTTCPYCRGRVEVLESPRRLEQTTPTHRIVEHVDSTRLRCEGSFAEVVTDDHDYTTADLEPRRPDRYRKRGRS